MEQVTRIELASSPWQGGIIAVILYLHTFIIIPNQPMKIKIIVIFFTYFHSHSLTLDEATEFRRHKRAQNEQIILTLPYGK